MFTLSIDSNPTEKRLYLIPPLTKPSISPGGDKNERSVLVDIVSYWGMPSRHVMSVPCDACSMGGVPMVKWHSGRFYRAWTLERILKGGVGVVTAMVSALLCRAGGSGSGPATY